MDDPENKPYISKTDAEIADLAKRVYRNEVFVSWMMHNPSDLPMVFMPVLMLDEPTRQQMVADNIQFFYEEYSRALPRSVNGNPCFMSMGWLNKDDGYRLHAKVNETAELVG
jgi:hypothetical protein